MKESFKKKLVNSKLRCAEHVERMGDENWQREQMPRMWKEKGGEEDKEFGGRTALSIALSRDPPTRHLDG